MTSPWLKARSKAVLLGSLYLSQGVPFGFFNQALPVVLREQHVDLRWVGLSTLLGLPWGLKWLWAPLVDRYYWPKLGRRRSWLVPLQVLTVVALLALAQLPPGSTLLGLVLGCLLTSAFAATADIATDGLAVEVLNPEERGVGNAVQVGAYRLGMIVGGGLLLLVFDRWGWATSLWLMASVLLLASIPVLLHRERSSELVVVPKLTGSGFVGRPGVWAWLAVLVVYKTGDAFATAMLRPFLVDAGFDLSSIALMLGTVGSLASLIGAILGGSLLPRLAGPRGLSVFALLTALCLAGYALTATFPGQGVSQAYWAALLVEHVVSSMATVALFTAMMHYCRPGSEGGDYTLQASVVVVCTGATAALSGFSAAAFGYALHFWLGCGFTLLVAATLWWLSKASNPREV